MSLLDIEKLIFATDYPDSRNLKPKEIYDKYFEILGKMDFTLEEAVRICKYNAIKMIKRNENLRRKTLWHRGWYICELQTH